MLAQRQIDRVGPVFQQQAEKLDAVSASKGDIADIETANVAETAAICGIQVNQPVFSRDFGLQQQLDCGRHTVMWWWCRSNDQDPLHSITMIRDIDQNASMTRPFCAATGVSDCHIASRLNALFTGSPFRPTA